QATVNITSTFDSRTHDVESSVIARGDLWRVEASHGTTSRNENLPLFLVQLGPLLFVRDSTLLLPVHLSKQHLLWYGYDRKSFMDIQFPNGQFTYVSGEGLTSSVFAPVLGGLFQAQGQFPGEMRFSFSCKNKWGTCVTPTVQWPDKSISLGLVQALAWQRSGLMIRPTLQVSMSPTFGGNDPGLRAELIHSVKEKLKLIYGCACTAHPSAFASVSVSDWHFLTIINFAIIQVFCLCLLMDRLSKHQIGFYHFFLNVFSSTSYICLVHYENEYGSLWYVK
ncbi:hypothetical protein GIB67_020698, partial [Kingdonia uniflora]